MKTILVPVDFSRITDRVLAEATALGRAVKGRVIVLNVTQAPVFIAEFSGTLATPPETIEIVVKAARKKLAELRERLKRKGVAAQAIQLTGIPAELIAGQAKKLSADYIVIGSHGHGAVYELLIGSTTSLVLKRAPCPVLIVPAAGGPQKGKRKGRR